MNTKTNAKKKRTISLLTTVGGGLAAVAAVMALGTSAAHATDFIPGSACAPANGSTSAYVTVNGAIGNRSTSSALVVSCPMVTTWSYSNIAAVVSATKNTAATMSCTLVSRNFANTSGATVSQSLTGTGPKTFSLSSIVQNYFNSVRCNIPNAGSTNLASVSWVNGYYYWEF